MLGIQMKLNWIRNVDYFKIAQTFSVNDLIYDKYYKYALLLMCFLV